LKNTIKNAPKPQKNASTKSSEMTEMTNDAYKAAELHRRQLFLERTNNAFAALKSNRKVWKEEQEERAVWDTALLDGLKDDIDQSM